MSDHGSDSSGADALSSSLPVPFRRGRVRNTSILGTTVAFLDPTETGGGGGGGGHPLTFRSGSSSRGSRGGGDAGSGLPLPSLLFTSGPSFPSSPSPAAAATAAVPTAQRRHPPVGISASAAPHRDDHGNNNEEDDAGDDDQQPWWATAGFASPSLISPVPGSQGDAGGGGGGFPRVAASTTSAGSGHSRRTLRASASSPSPPPSAFVTSESYGQVSPHSPSYSSPSSPPFMAAAVPSLSSSSHQQQHSRHNTARSESSGGGGGSREVAARQARRRAQLPPLFATGFDKFSQPPPSRPSPTIRSGGGLTRGPVNLFAPSSPTTAAAAALTARNLQSFSAGAGPQLLSASSSYSAVPLVSSRHDLAVMDNGDDDDDQASVVGHHARGRSASPTSAADKGFPALPPFLSSPTTLRAFSVHSGNTTASGGGGGRIRAQPLVSSDQARRVTVTFGPNTGSGSGSGSPSGKAAGTTTTTPTSLPPFRRMSGAVAAGSTHNGSNHDSSAHGGGDSSSGGDGSGSRGQQRRSPSRSLSPAAKKSDDLQYTFTVADSSSPNSASLFIPSGAATATISRGTAASAAAAARPGGVVGSTAATVAGSVASGGSGSYTRVPGKASGPLNIWSHEGGFFRNFHKGSSKAAGGSATGDVLAGDSVTSGGRPISLASASVSATGSLAVAGFSDADGTTFQGGHSDRGYLFAQEGKHLRSLFASDVQPVNVVADASFADHYGFQAGAGGGSGDGDDDGDESSKTSSRGLESGNTNGRNVNNGGGSDGGGPDSEMASLLDHDKEREARAEVERVYAARAFRTRNLNALRAYTWDQRAYLPTTTGPFSRVFREFASPRFWEKLDWAFRATILTIFPTLVLCMEPSTSRQFPMPTSVVVYAFFISQPTLGSGLRQFYIVLKGFIAALVVLIIFIAIRPGSAWLSIILLWVTVVAAAFAAAGIKNILGFASATLIMQFIAHPETTTYAYVVKYFLMLLIAMGFGLAAFLVPYICWSSAIANHHIGVVGDSVSLSVRGLCGCFWTRTPLERQLHVARIRQLQATTLMSMKKAAVAISEMGYEPHSGVYTAHIKTRMAFLKGVSKVVLSMTLVIDMIADNPTLVDTDTCNSFGRRLRGELALIGAAMDATLLKISDLDSIITADDIERFKSARARYEVAISLVREEVILNNEAYVTDHSDVLLGFYLFSIEELGDLIAGFKEDPNPPNSIIYFLQFAIRDLKSTAAACVELYVAVRRRRTLTRRLKESIKMSVCVFFAAFFAIYAVPSAAPAAGVAIVCLVYKPTGAESFTYAMNRLLGTVLGSITALISVQLAGGRRPIVYAISLILCFIGCWVQASPGFFPLGNALTTSVIVISLQYQSETSAMLRIEQNCFAIIVYFVISSVIWPLRARRRVSVSFDIAIRMLRESVRRLLENLDMPESGAEISADALALIGEFGKRIATQQASLPGACAEPTLDSAEFAELPWRGIIDAELKLQSTLLLMQYAYHTCMASTVSVGVSLSVHWVVLHRIAPYAHELSDLVAAACDIYLLALTNATVVPTAHLSRIRHGMIRCQRRIILTYINTIQREVQGDADSRDDDSEMLLGDDSTEEHSAFHSSDRDDNEERHNNISNCGAVFEDEDGCGGLRQQLDEAAVAALSLRSAAASRPSPVSHTDAAAVGDASKDAPAPAPPPPRLPIAHDVPLTKQAAELTAPGTAFLAKTATRNGLDATSKLAATWGGRVREESRRSGNKSTYNSCNDKKGNKPAGGGGYLAYRMSDAELAALRTFLGDAAAATAWRPTADNPAAASGGGVGGGVGAGCEDMTTADFAAAVAAMQKNSFRLEPANFSFAGTGPETPWAAQVIAAGGRLGPNSVSDASSMPPPPTRNGTFAGPAMPFVNISNSFLRPRAAGGGSTAAAAAAAGTTATAPGSGFAMATAADAMDLFGLRPGERKAPPRHTAPAPIAIVVLSTTATATAAVGARPLPVPVAPASHPNHDTPLPRPQLEVHGPPPLLGTGDQGTIGMMRTHGDIHRELVLEKERSVPSSPLVGGALKSRQATSSPPPPPPPAAEAAATATAALPPKPPAPVGVAVAVKGAGPPPAQADGARLATAVPPLSTTTTATKGTATTTAVVVDLNDSLCSGAVSADTASIFSDRSAEAAMTTATAVRARPRSTATTATASGSVVATATPPRAVTRPLFSTTQNSDGDGNDDDEDNGVEARQVGGDAAATAAATEPVYDDLDAAEGGEGVHNLLALLRPTPITTTTAAHLPPLGAQQQQRHRSAVGSSPSPNGRSSGGGDSPHNSRGSSSSTSSSSSDDSGAGGGGGGDGPLDANGSDGGSGGVWRDIPDQILDGLPFFNAAENEFVLTNRDIHSLEAFLFGVSILITQLDDLEKHILAMVHSNEMAKKL